MCCCQVIPYPWYNFTGGQDERSSDIFFTYDFAVEKFSRFMKKKHGVEISLEIFRKNYSEIWRKRELSNLSDTKLSKRLFSNLIRENSFDCRVPMAMPLCKYYCESGCDVDNMCYCRGDVDRCCDDDRGYSDGISYNPYEMTLGCNHNSAVLVTDASKIYGMPEYKRIKTPLLIVGRNTFINLMNEALERFCLEMKIEHELFSSQEIPKMLRENKMLVQRVAGDHMNNTFRYLTDELFKDNETDVYIIRLDCEEFELLMTYCKRDARFTILDGRHATQHYIDCRGMSAMLRQLCAELSWMYLGEESYSSDAYKDIKL